MVGRAKNTVDPPDDIPPATSGDSAMDPDS